MRSVRLLLLSAVVGVFVAVPSAASAGGGCHRTLDGGAPAEATGNEVHLDRNCMSPAVLRTAAGSTVTFVNQDPVVHNITWPGVYEDLDPSEKFTHRFASPGTYPYACTLHPGMTGAVVVGDGKTAQIIASQDGGDDQAGPISAVQAASVSDAGPAGLSLLIGAIVIALLSAAGGLLMGRRLGTS